MAATSVLITREILAQTGALPIGRAMPGTDVYLAHDDGTTPPEGERGEIIIAGPNVSPGYLGRPDLTASVFFERDGQPAYRTWRIAGVANGGWLYFEGRQDSQVKIHGYRIELADIEENFLAFPDVHDCAVVPVIKAGAVQFLVAFVVPDGPYPESSARWCCRHRSLSGRTFGASAGLHAAAQDLPASLPAANHQWQGRTVGNSSRSRPTVGKPPRCDAVRRLPVLRPRGTLRPPADSGHPGPIFRACRHGCGRRGPWQPPG